MDLGLYKISRGKVCNITKSQRSPTKVVALAALVQLPAAELLCDQRKTIGGGIGNQPFPAISLWARVPAADRPRFTVVAVQAYRTLSPSCQVAEIPG